MGGVGEVGGYLGGGVRRTWDSEEEGEEDRRTWANALYVHMKLSAQLNILKSLPFLSKLWLALAGLVSIIISCISFNM